MWENNKIEEDSPAHAGVEQSLSDDLLEYGWAILANVSDGDWTKQSEDWQEAVMKWRDKYHEYLNSRKAS